MANEPSAMLEPMESIGPMDPVARAWQLFAGGDLAGATALVRAAVNTPKPTAPACAALSFFLIHAGEFDEAAAILLPASERTPEHAPLHWYLGYLLQRRGDLPGAAAALERACRLDEALDEAAHALAWILNDLGRVDEALHWAQQALARARRPQRLLQTGWLLQASGQMQHAVAHYREAMQGFGPAAAEQARLQLHLSQCLFELKQHAEADAVLRRALDQWPDDLALRLESGWRMRARGDRHGALHRARALVSEHPAQVAPWHLQGVLQQELGEPQAADASFAEVLRLDARWTDAALRRAAILRDRGEFAEARKLVEQLLRQSPRQTAAQDLLAQLLLDLKDSEGARRVLVQRLRAGPRSADALRLLAATQARRGRPRLALRTLRRALALQPNHLDALRLLGWLSLEQGDATQTTQAIEALLDAAPDDTGARVQAVHMFAQLGQLARAEACAERAVAQAPDLADAWRALSQLRLQQRRLDEALAAIQQALRLAPRQTNCLQQLGWVLTARGAHEQAWAVFADALESDPANEAARLELAQAQGRAGRFGAGLTSLAPLLQAGSVEEIPAAADSGGAAPVAALLCQARLMAEGGIEGAVQACASLLRRDRHAPEHVMLALRLVGLGHEAARRLLQLVPVALLRDCWLRAIELATHLHGQACLARLLLAAREDLDDDSWLALADLYAASLSSASQPQRLALQARDAYRGLKVRSGSARLPLARWARLPRTGDGRPRIAYVAGQLHHSLLRRVLMAHAADRAEVYLYTSEPLGGLPGQIRQQPLRPADLVDSCAANGIDVLIDAGGLHPFEGQFALLQAYARRAAPVQIGWLGSWGGAGGLFDALLADEVAVPQAHESALHETVLRLAGGQWCWDPPVDAPAVAAPQVLQQSRIRYGVTARGLKLDQACIAAFAAVLTATPDATLCFIGEIAGDWPQRRELLACMQSLGVAPARVAFDPFLPRAGYLRWLQRIDIVLDSFPGNGGLSLLDPLWMGLPVITLAGAWPGARQGASLLTAIGRAQWVARDVAEFCATAVGLAADGAELSRQRASLRASILASPLVDGRRVAGQIETFAARLMQDHSSLATTGDPKSRTKVYAGLALATWLQRPGAIELPAPLPGSDIELSVIVVLFNQAGLSRNCLQALADQSGVAFETVIVDNASSDRTPELLARLRGATVLRNGDNLGFLQAARQGAAAAKGRFLVFLNNDAVLQQGALAAALHRLQADPSIGALGGRVVLTDGGLQEAGNKLFRDGSAGGIGRDEDPFGHAALAGRSTDYVSGVFLATPAPLWRMLDGFDERLAPAYYEDTDYCLRVWRAGFRVWYEPSVLLEHVESASATGDSAASLMTQNRALFAQWHAPWLAQQPAPQALPLDGDRWAAPDDRPRRPRVLFIDNEVPHMHKGGGLPRARLMLQALSDWPVTLFPLWELHDHWQATYASLPASTEVALGHGLQGLETFLERRLGLYEVLLVSRPPNLQALAPLRARRPELFAGMRLVYDAEALFALREIAMAGVQGRPLTRAAAGMRIATELSLAAGCSDVLVVSQRDAQLFEVAGHRTHILSHAIAARREAPGLAGRSGMLFVGALHPDTPNEDGVLWFIREVMPRLRRRARLAPASPSAPTPPSVPILSIVGVCLSERVAALAGDAIKILGPQPALEPHYDAARVFIAPVRFAGGVPAKVIEAAAAGLPVVASRLLQRQLDWRDGLDILSARDAPAFAAAIDRLLDDDATWQRQQQAAWETCARHYAPDLFADILRRVLTGPPERGADGIDAMTEPATAKADVKARELGSDAANELLPEPPPEHPIQPPTMARFARLMAQGRVEEARALLHQALAAEPNLPRVHLAQARLRWPGPDYQYWLQWLQRELRPGVYLEIGVEKGESLALAAAPTRAIGVDPAPLGNPLAACTAPTQLYRQTSAQFLAAPPADCALHPHGFDLCFVDGDHRFEAVLDDFIALERWAAPGALLLLHDTLPLNRLTAAPQRNSGFYTGDGWKILPCLRALRPELKILTLPVAPTGLSLIAGLDPGSTLLRERRDDILRTYAALDAARAVDRVEATLGPLGVNEPQALQRWLRQAGVNIGG